MNFPQSFFQKEVREGFEVSSLMKRCWAAQLEVLEQFNEICKRNDIRYYLGYGTLLGAVRHRGFIPWDDDIDIWMFREDVDRLFRETKEEFIRAGLELAAPFSRKDYHNLSYRVINTIEPRLDKEHLMKYWMFPFMAGLDIFPLDYVPENDGDREMMKTLIAIANQLALLWKDDQVSMREKKDMYYDLTQMLHIKPREEPDIEDHLWEMIDRIGAMYNSDDSDHVAHLSYYYEDPGRLFDKRWFGEPVYHRFENAEYPCPADHDSILKAEFGDDYMIPKIIYDHEYPYYKNWYFLLMEYFRKNNIQVPEIYASL